MPATTRASQSIERELVERVDGFKTTQPELLRSANTVGGFPGAAFERPVCVGPGLSLGQ